MSLVVHSDPSRALYVELKGKDIGKAIVQLEATLGYTRGDFNGVKRECFIVASRVPKYGPSVHKKSLKFYKRNKASLTIKNIRAQVEA